MVKRFNVDNPLLLHAICGGAYCENTHLQRCGGYLYYDEEGIGRAFLEYCYSVIFGIHRFPGFQHIYDRSLARCSWVIESGLVSTEDILAACGQLKDLYEFTKDHLASLGKEGLTLYRTIDHTEISSMWRDKDGKIAFNTNVMSSYTRNPELQYSGDVKIKRFVSIDDILMIDSLTTYENEDEHCQNLPIEGEYEVWVLCGNPFGEVRISPEDIVKGQEIIEALPDRQDRNTTLAGGQNDGSLAESYKYTTTKPCELTKFSRWLTKRNIRKLNRKL